MAGKDLEFRVLWDKACAAGEAAAAAVAVEPMYVRNGDTVYRVADGCCGFAWVNVKPGNSAFAKWLKANGFARADSYYGGVTVWVHEYNQSLTRKEAHARAMAKVFSEAGVKAYANSRMD